MLNRIVESLDAMPLPVMLLINAALAAFVVFAHGGALLITSSEAPGYADIAPLAAVTLPCAFFVLLASAVAAARRQLLLPVLSVQLILLAVGGVAMYLWALRILFMGIPAGNFIWQAGLLTGIVFYIVYALRRTALRRLLDRPAVRYAHLAALVVVFPVDLGVFLRAMLSFRH